MAWSYSALKQYETCARQYHEIRVLKNYPYERTEETRYGEELHAVVEGYTSAQKSIPSQFEFVKPVVDALLGKPGRKLAEQKLAVTAELKPCSWMAKDVWLRGVIDLLILDEDACTAWVVDYKTGSSKYPDKDQLDLMSMLVFTHYPEIMQVNSALIYVVKDVFIKHKRTRDEAEDLWWAYRNRVAKIDKALTTGVWNPTQSGLCKRYCAVTSCEFNGRN